MTRAEIDCPCLRFKRNHTWDFYPVRDTGIKVGLKLSGESASQMFKGDQLIIILPCNKKKMEPVI